MPPKYLHEHKDFPALLTILEDETGIQPGLIEKDYWIMHVLYGLKKQGFSFELKGGTSLSKGYKIIDRFSEDIDIHIQPPTSFGISLNPNNHKPNNIAKRKNFYDWLGKEITIEGIVSVERDTLFDDSKYRSGGIRLYYDSKTEAISGVKEGILLEAGFDNVTPNNPISINSWAYEKASDMKGITIKDNRALDIACYNPAYTLVEKLQTIATKVRLEREGGQARPNLMRQYYDIYCLLGNKEVQDFIGTPEYYTHKEARFSKADLVVPLAENEAFLLDQPTMRYNFKKRYEGTASLYYKSQPDFDVLLERLAQFLHKL